MAEPIQPRPEPQADEQKPGDTAVLPTEVVPVDTVVVVEPARKKKRRFGWLIAIGVVIVVLVVGFFVGDYFAKQYATAYVRDQIVSVLKLDPSTEVGVDLGGGSVILQALGGALDTVDVDVPSITFGDLIGSATISAAHVPLDGTKPVGALDITVTVSEADVKKIATSLSGIELKTIALTDGVIRVGTELNVLVVTLPVQVDLTPGTADGGITFTPESITLGDQTLSVDELRSNPLVSSLAGQLLNTQTVCVSQYLPQALQIVSVDVVGSDLVVGINGDGTALAGSEISTLGTCPKK